VKPYPSFEAPSRQHWLPSDPESDTFKDIEIPQEKDVKKHKANEEEKQKAAQKDEEAAKVKKHEDREKHKERKPSTTKIEKAHQKDEASFEEAQEKRQQLIERSLQYKKLYEEVPIPHDSSVLAKLLIAEHILAIHEQIEKPKKNAVLTKAELLNTFDYMGMLSEKFENPEEESTPEIQEAYENLLELAENALEQNPSPMPIVEANKVHAVQISEAPTDASVEPQAPSASETAKQPKLAALPKATAALVSALLAMRAPKVPVVQAPNPAPLARKESVRVAPAQPATPQHIDSEYTPQSNSPAFSHPPMSPIEARQAYRESIRAEHIAASPFHPGRQIASVAVAAALVSATHHDSAPPPPIDSSRDYHSVVPTPPASPHAELASLTYSHAKPVASHAETVHSYISSAPYKRPETFLPPSSPDIVTVPKPISSQESQGSQSSRKIEHLPLQTLLVMAETVPIGHGQRLRRAYEKGEIDKDGLIKVLKSRSKNLDFIREYKQQSERHHALIRASPEFLTSSKNTSSDTLTQSSAQTDTASTQSTSADTPASELSESKKQLLSEVLSPRQKQAEETPTGWKTILIVVAAIISVIVLIIVIFISR
jgi:hypothetical protein